MRRAPDFMSESFVAAASMRIGDVLAREDPVVVRFWAQYNHIHVPSITGYTHFRVCFDDDCNAGEMMQETRVALMLRGSYCEATRIVSSLDAVNHVEYEAVLLSASILNEVRVRAVRPNPISDIRCVPAFTVWGATTPDHSSPLDSPWVKEEIFDANGVKHLAYGPPWWLLVDQPETRGFNLEVRSFALCNVPRMPSCSESLRDELLEMPTMAATWVTALAAGCTPLTVALARLLLEERSKLRAFLIVPSKGVAAQGVAEGAADGAVDGMPAIEGRHVRAATSPMPADVWFRRAAGVDACMTSPRLKAWPGKGGVQQLVVLWMCAPLMAQHEYTEPELYAHISDHCAYQPDHGVVRKEMVRHGYLQQPVIHQNADHTTSTTYQLGLKTLEAALGGDIMSSLVQASPSKSKAKSGDKAKRHGRTKE